MQTTENLQLPYIMPAQAQKHVTHNEALQALDAIVQLSVLSRALAVPPAMPEAGDRYIVGVLASGVWENQDGKLACWVDGVWAFYLPQSGWLAWDMEDGRLYGFDGSLWGAVSDDLQDLSLLGINATADTTNRLSISAPASLFNHDGNGHQLKINKNSAADTSSALFQTAFSGRAEMGLTGDDGFHVKTSADGSNWYEGMQFEAGSGRVCFGSNADFGRHAVFTGVSPWVRISNTSETETGFEVVDAQAVTTQNLQIVYNCQSKISSWRVNGITALEIDSVAIVPKLKINADDMLAGEYVYSKSRVFIANNTVSGESGALFDPSTATNLDHFWNDDSANVWHFCNDTSYKADGNSTLRAAAFTTSSDYRLKERIKGIDRTRAVERVRALRPLSYHWKPDAGISDTGFQEGFLAHELSETFPNAVFGEKDGVSDKTQEPVYQSVDYMKLLPAIIAALQEALERIEVLEKA